MPRTNSRTPKFLFRLLAFVLGNLLTLPAQSEVRARSAPPDRLGVLDSIVQEAIRDGQIPGAVVLVCHDGQVIYRKAFGHRSLEPRREPMTLDTIFDLASLTKVVATTTAVMQLDARGKVRLNDPVAKYIPRVCAEWKRRDHGAGVAYPFFRTAGRFRSETALGRS